MICQYCGYCFMEPLEFVRGITVCRGCVRRLEAFAHVRDEAERDLEYKKRHQLAEKAADEAWERNRLAL
jgi:hypothetical protein